VLIPGFIVRVEGQEASMKRLGGGKRVKKTKGGRIAPMSMNADTMDAAPPALRREEKRGEGEEKCVFHQRTFVSCTVSNCFNLSVCD